MNKRGIDEKHLELAQKWLEGTITEEEKEVFSNWYNKNQGEEIIVPKNHGTSDDEYRNGLLNRIQWKISSDDNKVRRISWYRPAIAAAVALLLVSLGAVYYLNPGKKVMPAAKVDATMDILPGGDKATLTLGNGATLMLDRMADGAVTKEGGLIIRKAGGELVYESRNTDRFPVTYNTIRTPRGGQYRVVLPDGSKVWLNAASSLSYPTAFSGPERIVKLTGEGYFEITKVWSGNKSIPFRINVNDREIVEVLGTHFNIMAYSDEKNIKTTLLEGSVKVIKPGTDNSSILRPGQESVYNGNKGFQVRSDIDANQSVSWKNGLISYKNADIQTIMRQIERWYDVTVIYKDHIPYRSFTGGIARNSRLSSVLKVLELNDIHFELKEKQITVLP